MTARLPLRAGAPATPPGESGAWRRGLAVARRAARRRMFHAVWLPATAVALLMLLVIGYEIHAAQRSVLDRRVYERLRIGEQRSSVENRLPANQVRLGRAPADPPGVDGCRFYRTTAGEPSPAYRLCFTGGQLSHKDRLHLGD